jgi:uncharacterized membrane protein HdeD (DUF308 family)
MSWFQSKRPLQEWVLALIGAISIVPVSGLLAISFPPAVAIGLLVLYLVIWLGIVRWSTNSRSWFKPNLTLREWVLALVGTIGIVAALILLP